MWRSTVAFMIVLAFGIFVVPHATEAQPRGKIPRIGVLEPGTSQLAADPQTCQHGFQQGLRDLGYVEGHTIRLDYRYAEGQSERFSSLAAELVRLAPDLLWTYSSTTAQALKQVTPTIPIVVGVAVDLLEQGLIESLGRPGGNLTGIELRDIELTGKRLELFKEAVPTITRVAILVLPTYRGHDHIPGSIAREAQALGVQLQRVEASGPEAFEAAFAAMEHSGAEALMIMDTALFARHRQRLLELALQRRLPTMSGGRRYAEAGSLLTYGASPRDLCQRSAVLVDKILKGARPADLPIEQPTTFKLVVNLKTAQTLGLTLSPLFLVHADEVIK
jgi:putative ABC transport system substrate-binding protein